MQCDQIQAYLGDYVKRTLPTYKLAWVAQHLAGCERCRGLLRELTPAPVASAAEASHRWDRASDSYGVQRRVPGWVRGAGLALAILLAAAAAFAFRLAGVKAVERRPQARPAEPDRPIDVQTAYQSQMGVTLTLQSAAMIGGEVVAEALFAGRGLSAPDTDSWLRAYDEERREVPARVTAVRESPEGIRINARIQLPQGQHGFLLRFGAVSQTSSQRWLLILPDPFAQQEAKEQVLAGSPSGVKLLEYGVEGQLLNVRLRLPGWYDLSATPAFQLRDGEGAVYTATKFGDMQGFGNHDVELQYPMPRELRLPLTIVGSVPLRNPVGPWLLEGKVVE